MSTFQVVSSSAISSTYSSKSTIRSVSSSSRYNYIGSYANG